MKTWITLTLALLAVGMLTVAAAADDPGLIQRQASTTSAKATDPIVLDERVTALEKENVVLREDLGKARLDVRRALKEISDQHEVDMARFQQKVDDLNAQLAEDRERARRRERNLWIAVGVLAVAIIATSD
jgi:septal ring factor EnvC (AmiA/AmiB activator)